MAAGNEPLISELANRREITLTVTGRKSGRAISMPVWFVVGGHRLYLLPVSGSDTQWYRNVLEAPNVQIRANGSHLALTVSPITERAQVSAVIEKFRARYGDGGMKYYSKLDVAAMCQLDQ